PRDLHHPATPTHLPLGAGAFTVPNDSMPCRSTLLEVRDCTPSTYPRVRPAQAIGGVTDPDPVEIVPPNHPEHHLLETEAHPTNPQMMAHVVKVNRPVRGGSVRGIHGGTKDVRGGTDIQVAVLGEYVGAFPKGHAHADLRLRRKAPGG